MTEYLDCSGEASPFRSEIPPHRCWVASDITPQHWMLFIDGEAEDEIRKLAAFITDNPVQNFQRRASTLDLPACSALLGRTKSILDDGPGFAVLDRLPLDEYRIDTMVEVYWILGQMVGPPVAQKWNGEMIYDVRDTGREYTYGVRGSHTSVELVFHTDNAFARTLPDYVGLMCRHPALSGGVSRFCSWYSVHRRMLERFPRALRRLYRPMYFDRQKEHREGAPRVCWAPCFSWRNDRLNVRANSSLVRKGYDVAGEAMDEELHDALAALDEVCSDDDLWFSAALERGQIQYLNNHEVGHFRSGFTDHDDPEKKRHLYRLWHREAGASNYDGVDFR